MPVLSEPRSRIPHVADDSISPAARLATFQHGVLTRGQALELGLSREAIRERLRRGRWQKVYPGVYACFTGTIGRQPALWAAVLHAGPGAALSHQTAAQLHGLSGCDHNSPIHVTVPSARHPQPVRGLVIYRSDRVVAARHPCRQPPRTRIEETVVDLTQAAQTFDDALGRLCRACADRLTTLQRLGYAMAARKKLRWRADLAAALGEVRAGAHSILEFRYIRDVERSHGLPTARRQAKAVRPGRTEYRDNLYQDYGVAVETDGSAAHPQSARWLDIARDNAAASSGIITLRYSWSDVTTRPCRVAAEIAAVLGTRGWPGAPTTCGPSCHLPQPRIP
jgi:hypothetical protein